MNKTLNTIRLWLILALMGGVCLPTEAWPANADVAIYREVTGTEDEDNQTIHDEAFDTVVREDGEYTIGGGDVLVDLANGGHYFAWYTLHFIGTSGTDRTEHVGHLDLAGTDLEAGYGSGYKRGAQGVDEVYISGGAIIEAAAGDDIKVEAQNTSTVTTNNVQRRANLNGFMLLKLDDDWDYARLHESTGGTTYNSAAFTGFTWDTQDELDTASFAHTPGTANVTLQKSGHYLVAYTIHLNTGTNSQRIEMTSRVQIGGTTQEHCYSGTYIRGNNNGHGTNDGVLSGTCIVDNSIGGNDLVVQIARTGVATTTITDVGDESGLTIVKLPDDADYIRIHESGGGQSVDVTDSPITFDTNDEVDSAFTHSTSTNTDDITVNEDGDYLFTGCTRAGRASGTNRYAVLHEWRVNATKRQFGGFGWFNRGDQGSDDAFNSAMCGAIIMHDLSDTDVIDLVMTDESTSSGTEPTLTADQVGITGVYINSMFVNVSGNSDLANGTTVAIAVNGTLQSEFGTVVAGSFSIDVGKPVNSGDIITVWGSLVTDANEATSVTKYDGTGDITGLDLNRHILRIGSNDNASLTLTDLSFYDNSDSEDVMHLVMAGTMLIVDGGDDYTDDELEIVTGNTLTVGALEKIEGHDADLNGTVTVSGTLIFSGSWDTTGGTFNASGSTVMFTSTDSETIRSAGKSFDDVIINDGLLGYWKLDETASPARDSSGYDNHGTWIANTTGTLTTNGTFIHFENNGSVELDGTGDYINTGRAEDINNLTNGFTITAWIYPDAVAGTQRVVAASRENTANGFAFGLSGSNLRFSTFGVTDYDSTTITVNTSGWQHIAVVFDASNDANFYYNGTTTETVVGASAATANTDDDFFIGATTTSGASTITEEFDGLIDDVRIYNRELSAAQIQKMANGDQPATSLGVYTLQDSLDIDGSLALNAGELDVGSNRSISIAGNWLNHGGVFDEKQGDVAFNGTNQRVNASETFYDFAKSVTSTDTITFGQSSQLTVSDGWTITGASGNRLSLRSSTAGAQWFVDPQGARTVGFLDVQDSNNNSGTTIYCTNDCVDSMNNFDWVFTGGLRVWDGEGADGTCGGGAGDGNHWSCALNWTGDVLPTPADQVLFNTTSTKNADIDTNIQVTWFDIDSGYTGTITQESGNTVGVFGTFSQDDGTFQGGDAVIDINGSLLIGSGTFNSTTGTLFVGNDVVFSSGITFTNSGTMVLDGILTYTDNTSPQQNAGRVVIDPAAQTVTLGTDLTADSLTVQSLDTLFTDGYDIDLSGTLDLNGILNAVNGADGNTVINVGGLWDSTGGTFTNTNSTVIFDGTLDATITSGSADFNNLTLASTGTYTLQDTLDINGSLVLNTGTLDVGANQQVEVAGNWDQNGGVFHERNGTVVFDGSSPQTIFGSETFYNFDKSVTISGTMFFEINSTLTIAGTMTMQGASGQLLYLRSTSDGTQWAVDPQGVRVASFLDVQDSVNVDSVFISPANSINSGNNVRWFLEVSGFVYMDEGITVFGGAGVALAVNGVNVDSKTAAGDGSYTLNFATQPSNDIITVYINDETQNGVTVSETSTVLSGIPVYGDRLIVRHDDSGSLTNADLATAVVTGETDITDVFTVTAGNTLQMAFNTELYVDSVGAYVPGADVQAFDLDVNGIMTAGADTVVINGSFDATGGTFTTTGTVIFASTNPETITSAGTAFNDVIVNDGLVGFWRFEESAGNTCSNGVDDSCDLSGNRYHGFWNGTPTPDTTVTTAINHANDRSINLDGTSDYIAIRDLNYTDVGELDEITACAWINTTDTDGVIIDFDRSEYYSLSLNFNACVAGQVQWSLTNSSGTINDQCSAGTVNDGAWHHVCGVFDASLTNDSIIYIDGTPESVDAFTTNTPVGSGLDRWGYIGDGSEADVFNDSDPNNVRFAGLIDEVRVYHRALSAAEIQRLANGDNPGSGLGVYTLQDNLDVNGTLLILSGELDAGSNRQINVAGAWANFGGVFDAQNGEVVFDGSDQDVMTSETFYDVTKNLPTAVSRTLTFGERSTLTVNGSIGFSGFNKPNKLLLRSGDSGVRFTIDMVNGNDTANVVDVEDSQVSTNNIRALDSTDGINTDSGEAAPHWIFEVKGPLKGAIIIVD